MNFNIKQYVRESNLIEGIDDKDEDTQSLLAWEYLKNQPKITKPVLRKLHRLITVNQLFENQQGHFRYEIQTNVFIGGRIAPAWQILEALVDNWLLDYGKAASNPIEAHIRYEHMHPWIDGNGRTGRMILWWHEQKNGTKPTLFLDAQKFEKYYSLFSHSE